MPDGGSSEKFGDRQAFEIIPIAVYTILTGPGDRGDHDRVGITSDRDRIRSIIFQES